MNKKDIRIIVILAVVVLIVVGLYGSVKGKYNTFVTLDEQVEGAWAQVENVLQRRMDLIPNLVNTVKGYADFEQETLERVIQARASATKPQINAGNLTENPEALQQFMNSQNQLSGALSRLMVTVERYPDLKANQNFIRLQDELAGTENRIAVERRRFNETVREYNLAIRQFPNNIFAGIFGFQQRPYFEAPPEAEQVPEVDFGN